MPQAYAIYMIVKVVVKLELTNSKSTVNFRFVSISCGSILVLMAI